MAYRFKLDESICTGLARIGLEQINRAERDLKEAASSPRAVHDTRKSLKRLRALLRLVRPGLEEETFARENARFRDIAALFAGARDRYVLLDTLDKLQRGDRARAKAEFAAARELICGRPNGPGLDVPAAKAQAQLNDARAFFKKLKVEPDGFEILALGLEGSYRTGRRAFEAAFERPTAERFHEWRKGVQRHWRQMTLLSRAWPDWTAARAAEARALSQTLGDDHDLALLADAVRDGLSAAHARAIARLCRDRQAELRASAWPRGHRLFAEKPRRLRDEIGLYWSTAREMGREPGLVPLSRNGRPRAGPVPALRARPA